MSRLSVGMLLAINNELKTSPNFLGLFRELRVASTLIQTVFLSMSGSIAIDGGFGELAIEPYEGLLLFPNRRFFNASRLIGHLFAIE